MLLNRYFRGIFKRILKRAGYVVYRRPHLPKGADAFESIRSHWPGWCPRVIFDVGANVGQTIHRLRLPFPDARIFSFEPGSLAHVQLTRLAASDPLVRILKTALGETNGTATLHINPACDQNSLVVPTPEAAASQHAGNSEPVTVETLDHFCQREKINRIDLLKIDVEGAEFAVLRGARELLSSHAIDYIVIEAGLRPNPRFAPLHELIDHLSDHDFWLIGVYEQYGVVHSQTAEFCNALFARRPLLETTSVTGPTHQ